MKKIITDYFSFSKKERVAVFIVLLVAAGFIALPYFFGIKKKSFPQNQALQEQIHALQNNKKKSVYTVNDDDNISPQPSTEMGVANKITLFQFDPNTLDKDGWMRLGIKEKTAKTIINYHSKGGKFKTPEDIRKIWGLRKEDADRIIPYAVIPSSNANKSNDYNGFQKPNPTNSKPVLLDANTATFQELRTLPGIGNSLPYKIVKYRERLGGFLNMLQVKETFGMNDSIFEAILPFLHVLPTETKKLNINAASDFELGGHPYIDKNVAKAITIYRTQHGGFKSVEEIKKIVFITNEVYNKISPYLEVK
ncbi:MAG: helix-hairpin-helix domain-containing protein [Chitinophagaceae bacterium]|nr:helix-hairpin-helix domain-containing protein [Chitinophagaceae bacterium]